MSMKYMRNMIMWGPARIRTTRLLTAKSLKILCLPGHNRTV